MTNNIVVACENQDAKLLVNSVNKTLTEKVVLAINTKKKEIGKALLESAKPKDLDEDKYDSYDPKLREAIDYVVDSVLEGSLELENTVGMAAKQFNVQEESLREYFDCVKEKTEIEVDSTSSDDHDEKGGVRDDMDTNKRARYESVITFSDGKSVTLNESALHAVNTVHESLALANKKWLHESLTKNKVSCIKAVAFCHSCLK